MQILLLVENLYVGMIYFL